MVKEMRDHLDDELINVAIVDELELDKSLRRHLAECPVCSARKEAVAARLARFGDLSRSSVPLSMRRPAPAGPDVHSLGRRWRLRPSFGMGLAAASLLAFLFTPYFMDYLKLQKTAAMEKIYLEMLQDERFMSEIEKLEDDPLPKFYVDISDFSDQDAPPADLHEQDSKQPEARHEASTT